MDLFNRQLSIPDYEFFFTTIGYGIALLSFYTILTTYIQNPLLRSNTEIAQVRRAMRVIRISTISAIVLTVPLLYTNSIIEAPTSNPMTSFFSTNSAEEGGSVALGSSNSSGNGRMSWNFSVCRPIFGLLCFTSSLVADNHRFFRVTGVLMLFAQVCFDTIAAFDIAKANRMLETKCENSYDPATWDDSDLKDCLSHRDDQWWGTTELKWMFYRDTISSSIETFCLFLVCFVGVALGFRKNRYSYHEIHPRLNSSAHLWNELNKKSITRKNWMEKVKLGTSRRDEGKSRVKLM